MEGARLGAKSQRHALGVIPQVRPAEIDSAPFGRCLADHVEQVEPFGQVQGGGKALAQADEARGEPDEVGVLFGQDQSNQLIGPSWQ